MRGKLDDSLYHLNRKGGEVSKLWGEMIQGRGKKEREMLIKSALFSRPDLSLSLSLSLQGTQNVSVTLGICPTLKHGSLAFRGQPQSVTAYNSLP